MLAVILCAGKGTRLRPLTYGCPKSLLPVGGRPCIEYVLDNLLNCREITSIYVAVSHLRETLEEYLRQTTDEGYRKNIAGYDVGIETVAVFGRETEGDLKDVIFQKQIREPVLVAYGDIITKINVNELIEAHRSQPANATMALFNVSKEEASRFGIVTLEGTKITGFEEKPANPKGTLANAGYYIVMPNTMSLSLIKRKMEDFVFPTLAKERTLTGYVFDAKYWIDCGTLESYQRANKFVLQGIISP